MKKYIVLLILIFLCFGCKAEYRLKINPDKSVEETVLGMEDEDFFAQYPKSSKKRVIRFSTSLVNDYLEKLNYQRKIINKGNYSGEKVSKKYKNLNEYFEKSKVYDQLFEEFDTNINGRIVTISLKKRYPKNGNSVFRYIIDDCEVKVFLPYKVKEHNADQVDEEKNCYTWNLNIDDKKEIYIQFDTSKKVINEGLKDYLTYIIIGGIVITLLVIYVIIGKKNNRNKI